jgi:hypothetical protein
MVPLFTSLQALGFTYRDVEKASDQIEVNRGRPDFIFHISRLAEVANRGVVPSLHKLYSWPPSCILTLSRSFLSSSPLQPVPSRPTESSRGLGKHRILAAAPGWHHSLA